MQKLTTIVALLFTFFAISSCSSNEIGQSKDVAQDKIYQDYRIQYAEGNGKVSIHGQFRFAGSNGTTLVLSSPSQVSFDGDAIKVDSSGPSGAFYQTYKPITGFFGKHHLIFTDTDNRKFDNDLSFDTFRLVNIPANVSRKKDLIINFQSAPLQVGDQIELNTSRADSSFRVYYESGNGQTLRIPAKYLSMQKNAEIQVDATLTRRIPMRQQTMEGGEMSLTYMLKPVTIKFAD
jgi:hypothetical protein